MTGREKVVVASICLALVYLFWTGVRPSPDIEAWEAGINAVASRIEINMPGEEAMRIVDGYPWPAPRAGYSGPYFLRGRSSFQLTSPQKLPPTQEWVLLVEWDDSGVYSVQIGTADGIPYDPRGAVEDKTRV